MKWISFLLPLAGVAAAAAPLPAQLSSTRTQALEPALARLFPDEWSDGARNPALIAAGGLAIGRIDWSREVTASRIAAAGARVSVEPAAILIGGARRLEDTAGELAPDQLVMAARLGRADALGVRMGRYRSDYRGDRTNGRALAAGGRASAGREWELEALAEFVTIRRAGQPETAYRGGEFVLRRPGPERVPQDAGWQVRVFRFAGGVGSGALLGDPSSADELHWAETSVVHLHGFRAGSLNLGIGWGIRFTYHRLEPDPTCRSVICDAAAGAERRGIALDVGAEARPAPRVVLRGGFSWCPYRSGDGGYLPTHWRRFATVLPAGSEAALRFGMGWELNPALALDAAVDPLVSDDYPGRPPVSIQASYRF